MKKGIKRLGSIAIALLLCIVFVGALIPVSTVYADINIYRTKSGTKYHIEKCGSGTFYQVSLEDAKKAGLTPCSKCFPNGEPKSDSSNDVDEKTSDSSKKDETPTTPVTKPVSAKYTITFDANDGTSAGETKTVTQGGKYGELPVPTRDDYVFVGWFTKLDGGNEITANTTVNLTGNQTLYAQWEKEKATQSIKCYSKSKSIKYNSLQKKKQVYSVLAYSDSFTKCVFKKTSGNSQIKVSSSGVVTVAKGLKKGVYKVSVKISVPESDEYKAAEENITLTINIK